MSARYRVTSLDSIEALPGPGSLRWLPVRHELGIGAFGTNAYDLACWHALYGTAAEARTLLERAIELGGDEVRAQAQNDPDLASLRDGEAPA